MTSRFDMHGLVVEVSGAETAVVKAATDRFRRFPAASATGPADLRFDYRADALDRPVGLGRPVYEPPAGEVLHFDEEDVFFIDYASDVRVVCESASGETRIAVGDAGADLWLLSRPMLTLPLLEMAKRRSRFGLHAGAVARDGRSILLPGSSGSGKSTLSLALALGGYDFVSDDLVFLAREEDGAIAVESFPDDVDVTPTTAGFFPELGLSPHEPAPEGWPKHAVAPENVGAKVVISSAPAALVFPRIADVDRSVIRPITAEEALLELAPNVLLTDAPASQAHLDMLGDLVATCPSFRIDTAQDWNAMPGLVQAVLA
jgi:hypothetical protein